MRYLLLILLLSGCCKQPLYYVEREEIISTTTEQWQMCDGSNCHPWGETYTKNITETRMYPVYKEEK